MSTPAVVPVALKKGIVKQVLSGDSVIIRGYPKGGPPPEKQITFSNVFAPKLARRPAGANAEDSKDEAWAWEAREFLRSKLIGEEVYFCSERPANANRDYGVIYLGSDPATAQSVTELLVQEGLVSVRKDNARTPSPELQRLIDLEEAAKSAGKGKWNSQSSADHVRNIRWTQENQRNFVDQLAGKPVKAIIEHVRDGSTVRAFLVPQPDYSDLVPEYLYITLMISGIRCPGFKLDSDGKPDHSVSVDYAEEARYFVESRLLQREVQIVLESVNNTNFVGSILFPKGNIAEALLREGFAKCVDWSMAFMRSGADKLRAAERQAKEKRVRLWKDYQSNAQTFTGKEKDFNGIVVEIYNGDAISVKTPSGVVKKVFFSSIRPPREAGRAADDEGKLPPRPKNFRPLYDIPWMYECREFLRKKLIGKKIQCNLDYISPARDNFPEKYCYTVTVGGQNVAELLVGKGLATVVRYRQDDDQRSSRYDELLGAEAQAIKSNKGVHGKKEAASMRINDLTVDHSRIKQQYLPSWQRALRTEAIVEFIASGSRFRLFLPKDSCLVTFLLAGISCPRSSRPSVGGAPAQEGEPFGDEALNFVREKILQRDVNVHIDTTDKAATSVIGWLWTDANVNLSVLLVEEGLATVHFSAEKTEYYRALKTAEDSAKAAKKKIWANYVEEIKEEEVKEEDKDDKVVERKVNHEKVVVTEVTPELHFYAQHTDQGAKLETLMAKLRKEFQESPPLAGAFTPKRNDLCAAQFSEDNEWYRAKVEKVQGHNATILYVDYGNKETVPTSRLASLPPAFISDKPYANYYGLALVVLPPEEDDKTEAVKNLAQDALNRDLLLNVEYKINGQPFATLSDPTSKADIGKALVADGILLVEKRRERKLAKMVEDYVAAEALARKDHLGVWEYGDITADDAKEFGRN
ncbi:staphylococcal nuclease domain-containing protein 1 [Contarinia nasturtii]|uniref:staphylococcal nuclease domain-containing protein 1 n=1 Tax=Contarinia nasturtii TaxID=265458 RepID=UPI0012D3CF66|nr:staphylococcal nuclease domain-containing protein 1 [Contarinia nasturtii]